MAPDATVACAAIRDRSPIVTGPALPGAAGTPTPAKPPIVQSAPTSIPAQADHERARPDERAGAEAQRPVERLQAAARPEVDAVAEHDLRALGHADGHVAPERDPALQPQPAASPQAQQREPQRAETGGLGDDGVGAGRWGHDRIFADPGAIALTLRPAAAEGGLVDLAHATKKKKKKKKKRCTPAKRRPAKKAKGSAAQAEATAAARKKRRKKKRPVCKKKKKPKPRPQSGTHPAAPRPATPPAPGPAAPVPPPPPPPLLKTIKSPIAVYSGTFGPRQAERLLWRAGFGPRPGQAKELAALGLEKAVLSLSRPSGTAPMDGPAPTDEGEPLSPYDHYDHDLLFWLDRMVRSRHQLVERLALVFHDWFATSNDAVGSSRLMLDQTNLFRANGLGNFKTMVHKITQDPAMILFLDLASNTQVGAERELRPRADGAVHARRRPRGLHRGRRARARPLADRLALRLERRRSASHNFRWDEGGPLGPDPQDRLRQDRPLDVGGRRAHGRRARTSTRRSSSPSSGATSSRRRPTPPPRPSSRRSTRARATRSGPCSRRSSARPQLYDGPRMVKPPTVFVAGMLRARKRGITDNRWSWVLSGAGQRVYYPPDVAGWDDKRWLDTNTTLGRWQAVYYMLERRHRGPELGTPYTAETAEAAVPRRARSGATPT